MHAADLQAQDRLELLLPFLDVRLASGDHRLLAVDFHRQDLEALRVGVGHDVRDRGEVDFQRVDVEIPETDLGRQPLGEQFEVQQLVRRQQGFPFLVGNHRERMMVGALHAPVGDQLVGLGASDDAVLDQIVQHLGQAQFAVGGGFGGGLHGTHYSGIVQRVQITPAIARGYWRVPNMLGIAVLCRGIAARRSATVTGNIGHSDSCAKAGIQPLRNHH